MPSKAVTVAAPLEPNRVNCLSTEAPRTSVLIAQPEDHRAGIARAQIQRARARFGNASVWALPSTAPVKAPMRTSSPIVVP